MGTDKLSNAHKRTGWLGCFRAGDGHTCYSTALLEVGDFQRSKVRAIVKHRWLGNKYGTCRRVSHMTRADLFLELVPYQGSHHFRKSRDLKLYP